MQLGISCTRVEDLSVAEGLLIQFGDATQTTVVAGGNSVGVVAQINDRFEGQVRDAVTAINAQADHTTHFDIFTPTGMK